MTDYESLLPSTRNRRRQVDGDLHLIVLHTSLAAGREVAGRLASLPRHEVDFHCTAVESAGELRKQVARQHPDALVLHDAVVELEKLQRLQNALEDVPIIVLSSRASISEQVEWVHHGVQDVLRDGVSGPDLARALRLSVERRRLINDLSEALRLEQEALSQMQNVMDQLVGYAARVT